MICAYLILAKNIFSKIFTNTSHLTQLWVVSFRYQTRVRASQMSQFSPKHSAGDFLTELWHHTMRWRKYKLALYRFPPGTMFLWLYRFAYTALWAYCTSKYVSSSRTRNCRFVSVPLSCGLSTTINAIFPTSSTAIYEIRSAIILQNTNTFNI